MAKAFETLGGTDQAARAANVDLAFLGHRIGIAHRTAGREFVSRTRFISGEIFDHLRNHVARALDPDTVADAQAEALDLIAIVERDVGDDDAADANRRKPADGSKLAGAADLDVDRFKRRFGLLGGEFVRKAPARRTGDETEPLLQVEPVDLVDDSVDVERKVGARFLDRAIMGEHVDQPSQRTSRSATGIPKPSIRFIASYCVSASDLLSSPQPCARKRKGRAAVMLGSF